MYRYYDSRIRRECINIAPGEFLSTNEDIVINTVLGSCVSVALYDTRVKVGGLNHFMLAEARNKPAMDDLIKIERYGLYAMDSLINSMMKYGSVRKNLRAKIFGGSRVLEGGGSLDIGAGNIRFAYEYLTAENIPIDRSDTGGTRARKIYLFPLEHRVLMRKVRTERTSLRSQMKDYRQEVEKTAQLSHNPVLF